MSVKNGNLHYKICKKCETYFKTVHKFGRCCDTCRQKQKGSSSRKLSILNENVLAALRGLRNESY